MHAKNIAISPIYYWQIFPFLLDQNEVEIAKKNALSLKLYHSKKERGGDKGKNTPSEESLKLTTREENLIPHRKYTKFKTFAF